MSGTPGADGDRGPNEAPHDPEALREEIRRTRAELGDTAEALSERADVAGHAKQRIADATGSVRGRVTERTAAVRRMGEELRERVAEPDGVAGRIPPQAQDTARRAVDTARRNPRQVAYVVAGILVLRMVRRARRRRRERARSAAG